MADPPSNGGRSDPRSPLRQAAGGIGVTMTRYVLTGVLGIGWAMLLARGLGPAGAGLVNLATLAPAICAAAAHLGFPVATAYLLARNRFKFTDLVSMNLLLSAGLGLPVCVLGMLILHSMETTLQPEAVTLLRSALYSVPALVASALLGGVLHGAKDFRRFALVSVMPIVLALGAGLILIVLALLTAERLVWSWVVAQYVTVAWLILLLGRNLSWPGRTSFRRYLGESLSYGWPTYVDAVAWILSLRIGNFILGTMYGLEAVGIYSSAVWIAERLWLVSYASGFVLLPVVASMEDAEEQRRRVTLIVARWSLAFAVTAASALMLLSYPLVLILFGESFRPSIAPLIALLPGAVLLSHSRVLGGDLAARGRADISMRIGLVALAVIIVGNLVLVPPLGALGAALASTLSYTVSFLLRLRAFCEVAGVERQKVLYPQPEDWELGRRAWSRLRSRLG